MPLPAWGQLFPCDGCALHPGKGHTSQAWAEPCFSAEKDLYFFINQKPDTKALVYPGVSPSSSAGHGGAGSTCTDRLASDPWAQAPAAACRGPRHPWSLLQCPRATAAPSSPPSAWDQAQVVCFPVGPTGEWSSGAERRQLCYQPEPWLGLHPVGFLCPLVCPYAVAHSCTPASRAQQSKAICAFSGLLRDQQPAVSAVSALIN